MAKLQGSRFWVLGSIYWMVVAGLVGVAHYFWPHVANSAPFVIAAVLGAVIAGFSIVYLFRPK